MKTKVAQAFARAHLNALASSETNIVQDGSSVSLNQERENEVKKKQFKLLGSRKFAQRPGGIAFEKQ